MEKSLHPKIVKELDADDLPAIVGANLRRIRTQRGYSLEHLAGISSVSRAMLGQIETGKSAPTISLLWKVATSLEVPFSSLIATQQESATVILRKDQSKVLKSRDGKFTSRALFPFDGERKVEFYELRLAPHHHEKAEAHAPGTTENIVVLKGKIEIEVAGEHSGPLTAGDAILFKAESAHSYRNLLATEAVLYMVITYIEKIVPQK